MNDLNQIRRIFIRQLTQNDCGVACLSMVLNYSGRETEVNVFRERTMISGEGLSLLELRNLAAELNLPARCVQMNIQFLRECCPPYILHMVNEYGEDHFQVYCGAKKHEMATGT
jgi:ABC-type bacteriocin/lantibiotic exporter with double-glycine peptidase domain